MLYRRFLIMPTALFVFASPMLWGQAERAYEEEYGVARVSLINGDVSVRRGDSGDWVAATVNAPLVVEDSVVTGGASRAEVQFDYANMIRLDADSEIRMGQLEYRRYLIQVIAGTVSFSVVRDIEAQVELSTPAVSLRPLSRGLYRMTVLPGGELEITVRAGEAEIYGPRGVQRIGSNRTVLVRGPNDDPEFRFVSTRGRDAWDRWNEERDRRLLSSRAYRYVHRDIYGADELDDYGEWVNVPPYGFVWRPQVAVDWAPYRYGRWAWMDFYGWTWISQDPWGWAPFHYGRWFHYPRYGWCWYPGAFAHPRHYWSPALVTFFGFGGYGGFRAGIGFGWGNVGWVPLAPFETFHPWYGRGFYRGFRNNVFVDNSVRIVNNVNVYNDYRNARVNNGITAINADRFGRGGIADRVRVSRADLERSGVVRGALPLSPSRESLRVSDRAPNVTASRRTADTASFRTRQPVTRPERASFEQQQAGMERAARATFGEGGGAGSMRRTADRANTGGAGINRGGAGGSPGGGGAGGGDPSPGGRDVSTGDRTGRRTADSATSGGGWRTFGEPRASGGDRSTRVVRIGPSQTAAGDQPTGEAQRGESAGGSGWRTFGQPLPRDSAGTGRRSDSAASGRVPSRVQVDRGGAESPGQGSGVTSPPEGRLDRSGASDRRLDQGSGRAPVRSRVWGDAAPPTDGSAAGSRLDRSGAGSGRMTDRPAEAPSRIDRGSAGGGWRSSPDRPSSGGAESGGPPPSRIDRNSGGSRRMSAPAESGGDAAPSRSLDINPRLLRERGSDRGSNRSSSQDFRSAPSWRGDSSSGDSGRSRIPSGGSPGFGGSSGGRAPRMESAPRSSGSGGFSRPSGGSIRMGPGMSGGGMRSGGGGGMSGGGMRSGGGGGGRSGGGGGRSR